MALFLNTFVNKVDRKGRVSVPATFRSAVEGSGYHGIVIYNHLEQPCIEGADITYFKKISATFSDQFGPFSSEPDDLASAIMGGSAQLAFDPDGRITLPQEFRTHAGIEDAASFVGLGGKFRIWAPQRFEDYRVMSLARAAEAARKMRPIGGGADGGGGV